MQQIIVSLSIFWWTFITLYRLVLLYPHVAFTRVDIVYLYTNYKLKICNCLVQLTSVYEAYGFLSDLLIVIATSNKMTEDAVSTVLARFKSETGETVSNMMDLPRDVTVNHLQLICNSLLKQVIMINNPPGVVECILRSK